MLKVKKRAGGQLRTGVVVEKDLLLITFLVILVVVSNDGAKVAHA